MSADERMASPAFKEKLAYGNGRGLPLHLFNDKFLLYLRKYFPTHFRVWETGNAPDAFTYTEEDLTRDLAGLGLDNSPENRLAQRRAYQPLVASRRERDASTSAKLYGVMWDALTDEGRQAVRSEADFSSFDRASDPVRLRNAIMKTHRIASGSGTKSAAEITRYCFDEYYTCRMRPDQTLLEYRNYFDSLVKNIQSAGGATPSDADQSHDFIRWLDDSRHYALKAHVSNMRQEGKGPTTLEEAFQLAYHFEPPVPVGAAGRPARGGQHSTAYRAKPNASLDSPGTQPHEGVKGHSAVAATGGKGATGSTSASRVAKCNHCGKLGHTHEDCWTLHPEKRNRAPRTKVAWAAIVGWMTKEGRSPRDQIIVDSGCSGGLFCNSDLLSEIIPCSPTPVEGIGGELTARHTGKWGPVRVYYHPDAPTNLVPMLSLTREAITAKVHVGSDAEQGLELVMSNGTTLTGAYVDGVLVLRNPRGLVATVGGNEARFTKREVVLARDARRLQEILAFPPTSDLNGAIRHGTLSGIELSTSDVARSEVIYGPHDKALAGRTVNRRKTPLRFVNGTKEVQIQSVHCDVFYVDGLPFLMAIAKPLNLMFVTDVSHSRGYGRDELTAALKSTFDELTANGFGIQVVYFDGEARRKLGKVPYPVDVTGAGDHEATAERAIRTLKERVTSLRAQLPYRIPEHLVKHLVKYVATCLNLFPSAQDLDTRSPRERFSGIKPSLASFRGLGFGDYCLVSSELSAAQRRTTTHERTLGAIAVRPCFNTKGTWEFISLLTGNIIHRSAWDLLPVPDEVIRRINGLSASSAAIAELPRAIDQHSNMSGGVIRNAFDALASDDPSSEEPVTADELDEVGISSDPIASGRDNETADTIIELDDSQDPEIHPEPDGPITDELADDEAVEVPHTVMPQAPPPMLRRSERIRAKAYHVSLRRAIEKFGQEGREAAVKEIRQLMEKRVFEMIPADVPAGRTIPSQLFLREKRDAQGTITKIKGRLVAGGHRQLRNAEADNSSPTISTEALLTVVAVAATKGHKMAAIDVEGAYLECDIDEDITMTLPTEVSELLVAVDPSTAAYIRSSGGIAVKLKRALYGTVQASRLWYEKVSTVLVGAGFRKNQYDACVFHKTHHGENIVIGIHVDDLLVCSASEAGIDFVASVMKKSFRAINETRGALLEYLGMRIEETPEGVVVSMPGHARECIASFAAHDALGRSATPSDAKLFEVDETLPQLHKAKADAFHTIVAKTLFLGTKTRPDIATTISFLTTRVSGPTMEDWNKLRKLMSYISGTIDHGILYRRGKPAALTAYIDASHGCHRDGSSRTGIVITLGGGAVCFKSTKQRTVTLSSTEAELVALTEGSSYVMWLRNLLDDLWVADTGPTVVYQDNESTLKLVASTKTHQQRTRHLNCKYFSVRERVNEKSIALEHLPGELMPADVLTKGVDGSTLRRLLPSIMHTPAP
jgi:hypothetical protein